MDSCRSLLMLEDDPERIVRFTAILHAIDASVTLHIWKDAHVMMREAGFHLPTAVLLSLDHDLESEPGAPDPGDGYMVAQWLTSQPIICPVIVHSSNRERSTWMMGAFELADWPHYRVPPIGDDWIEFDWRRVVRRLLAKSQRTHHRNG